MKETIYTTSNESFPSAQMRHGSRKRFGKRNCGPYLQSRFSNLLACADVEIDGGRPWDLQVYNPDFYSRFFSDASLGLGESYMAGWWECPALDQFFARVLRAGLADKVTNWKDYYAVFRAKLFNYQKQSRAFQVGRHHYDIGNDLYQRMLDKRMIYSCAYWPQAESLDAAQEAKLDLVCRKLDLKPGMRLLDIGCGWGGMARFAAENYGAEVVGITVSKEQMRYAADVCTGLPVVIKLQDYRTLSGIFDRVVSLGMFEHVGYKNYTTFMRSVRRLLEEDGLFLLHTIGNVQTTTTTDKWIERYIFPNSMLPSAKQVTAACEGFFVIEDWHNFGADYDTTLMHWYKKFEKSWPEMKGDKYDDRFFRMWKYYLLACAGSFRARKNQLWQLVLSPMGRIGCYRAPR